MKITIALLLALPLSFNIHAQDWKEYCITVKGDTLRAGSSLVLKNVDKYKFVTPSKYFPTKDLIEQQPISKTRYNAYSKYLHTHLKGDTVTITRFTRYKSGKKYTQVAVFQIQDPNLTFTAVDYTIEVNEAIEAQEIEVISSTK
ncbi:MAG: hypothetical protein JNK00_13120 [Flavipsychrobacter sp.]|nr:hypothetical protein [Flavipsychrobacter sp.]